MNFHIKIKSSIEKKDNIIFLIEKTSDIPPNIITKDEIKYIKNNYKKNEQDFFLFNKTGKIIIIKIFKKTKNINFDIETVRRTGNEINVLLNKYFIEKVIISCSNNLEKHLLALAEGMVLGAYGFNKYKNIEQKPSSINNKLHTIFILQENTKSEDIEILKIKCEAVYRCRDLVNEPALNLTASIFSDTVKTWANEANVKFESINKKKIETLKMGGLLAVNSGSFLPPTFNILEWNPQNAINNKPIILIGKGITFDTGGMSLKSSANMNGMKSDMSGAAVVASVICALAKIKLPINIIGLIPATDNRPGEKAIVPGDIITMMDGTTVEVLNTDAEGRLILADALSYAKKFKPSLVIDIATLTGAAMVAIGTSGIAAMQYDAHYEFDILSQAGNETYERIAELPNWDDYKDAIKSDIADIKNIGGKYAGAITAFKFLEHFVNYPFIHLDIAGPAFLDSKDSYRGSGGTGVGVRLLLDYLINKTKK